MFLWVKSLNDECSGCSLLEMNFHQYGVHAKIIGFFFCKTYNTVHGELDIEFKLNSRIKEKLINHLNLINVLLGKKTQEMGRKKLTYGVKNSLKVE